MDFANDLIQWYQENKRILPWRCDKNPYHVWISEIMLQQTRIEAVIGYYERFIARLPMIHDLAIIEEDELLKLWQGLGYYNRARNLKKAAIMIEEVYHGVFPSTYEEILSLPGIGEYTAGAISSICFDIKRPAVDGNVLRVLSRVRKDPSNMDEISVKKKVYHFLLENMPDMPGDFNEGIMELGEVICVPNGVPLCGKCPICQYCSAYKDDEQLLFPVKSLKKEKKEISYYASIFVFQNKVALIKRSEGLLKNMYGFLLSLEKASFPYFHIPIKPYKHVFTHVVWNITGDIYFVDEELEGFIWANLEEIESIYAIPTAFLSIVQTLKEVLK